MSLIDAFVQTERMTLESRWNQTVNVIIKELTSDTLPAASSEQHIQLLSSVSLWSQCFCRLGQKNVNPNESST